MGRINFVVIMIVPGHVKFFDTFGVSRTTGEQWYFHGCIPDGGFLYHSPYRLGNFVPFLCHKMLVYLNEIADTVNT